MTPEQLAETKAKHTLEEKDVYLYEEDTETTHIRRCKTCLLELAWPCTIYQLLTAYEQAEAELLEAQVTIQRRQDERRELTKRAEQAEAERDQLREENHLLRVKYGMNLTGEFLFKFHEPCNRLEDTLREKLAAVVAFYELEQGPDESDTIFAARAVAIQQAAEAALAKGKE